MTFHEAVYNAFTSRGFLATARLSCNILFFCVFLYALSVRFCLLIYGPRAWFRINEMTFHEAVYNVVVVSLMIVLSKFTAENASKRIVKIVSTWHSYYRNLVSYFMARFCFLCSNVSCSSSSIIMYISEAPVQKHRLKYPFHYLGLLLLSVWLYFHDIRIFQMVLIFSSFVSNFVNSLSYLCGRFCWKPVRFYCGSLCRTRYVITIPLFSSSSSSFFFVNTRIYSFKYYIWHNAWNEIIADF